MAGWLLELEIEKAETITKRLWKMVEFTPGMQARKMFGAVIAYLLFHLSGGFIHSESSNSSL